MRTCLLFGLMVLALVCGAAVADCHASDCYGPPSYSNYSEYSYQGAGWFRGRYYTAGYFRWVPQYQSWYRLGYGYDYGTAYCPAPAPVYYAPPVTPVIVSQPVVPQQALVGLLTPQQQLMIAQAQANQQQPQQPVVQQIVQQPSGLTPDETARLRDLLARIAQQPAQQPAQPPAK